MILHIVVGIMVALFLFIMLLFSGYFAVRSAEDLNRNPTINSDSLLKSAYDYMTINAVLIWVLVFLVLVSMIVYFVFWSETASTTFKWVISVIAVILVTLCIVVGVLSSIAITQMNASTNFNNSSTTDQSARSYAQWVAGLTLASAALVIVVLLIVLIGKTCPDPYKFFTEKPPLKQAEIQSRLNKIEAANRESTNQLSEIRKSMGGARPASQAASQTALRPSAATAVSFERPAARPSQTVYAPLPTGTIPRSETALPPGILKNVPGRPITAPEP